MRTPSCNARCRPPVRKRASCLLLTVAGRFGCHARSDQAGFAPMKSPRFDRRARLMRRIIRCGTPWVHVTCVAVGLGGPSVNHRPVGTGGLTRRAGDDRPSRPWQKGTGTWRVAVLGRVRSVWLGASPLLPQAPRVTRKRRGRGAGPGYLGGARRVLGPFSGRFGIVNRQDLVETRDG